MKGLSKGRYDETFAGEDDEQTESAYYSSHYKTGSSGSSGKYKEGR